MSTRPARTKASKTSAFTRAMLGLQVQLLRRNWMGAMGNQLMVITVVGRVTGRRYSTPIGFLSDGDTLVSVSRGSQWVRNALAAPEVLLDVKGRSIRARATRILDRDERERILALYLEQRRANFASYFGVPADSSPEALSQALAAREIVRFTLLPD